MSIDEHYVILIQSLRLVASPYEVQVSSMPDFVVVADEIALTYDNAFILAPKLKEQNLISEKIFQLLQEIDVEFSKMSEIESLWDKESLRANVSWQNTRRLANEILKALNEPYDKPDLNFITWIK